MQAGKTYYFKQKLSPGFMRASVKLVSVSAAQAKEWITTKKTKLTSPTKRGWQKGAEMVGEHYAKAKADAVSRL